MLYGVRSEDTTVGLRRVTGWSEPSRRVFANKNERTGDTRSRPDPLDRWRGDRCGRSYLRLGWEPLPGGFQQEKIYKGRREI